jgi:NAD(P)H-hydrate repair Nnr-like enzyme with NAD(P)H-hydrate epimerase domain
LESETNIRLGFKASNGSCINSVSSSDFKQILLELKKDYFISETKTAEAAAFSMAMVVRYALGLDAKGGEVLGITRKSLSGVIAAATLRHLANGGAKVMIGIECEPDPEEAKNDALTAAYLTELEALNALEVPIFLYSQVSKEELEAGINSSHNVILGLFDQNSDNSCDELSSIIDILNESATPIHCVGAPLGCDLDTGKYFKNPLYASSTLSLGCPFNGYAKAHEIFGRHYICDISLPKQIREKYELDGEGLFSEQPVVPVQLIPS